MKLQGDYSLFGRILLIPLNGRGEVYLDAGMLKNQGLKVIIQKVKNKCCQNLLKIYNWNIFNTEVKSFLIIYNYLRKTATFCDVILDIILCYKKLFYTIRSNSIKLNTI